MYRLPLTLRRLLPRLQIRARRVLPLPLLVQLRLFRNLHPHQASRRARHLLTQTHMASRHRPTPR